VVAVLLCVLWWRDYNAAWPRIKSINVTYYDGDYFPGHGVLRRLEDPPAREPTHSIVYKEWFEFSFAGIPYVALTLSSGIICAAPWLRLRLVRFSLRTLLIATTLVAVALGFVVWASR
jgi:hypothetical protein